MTWRKLAKLAFREKTPNTFGLEEEIRYLRAHLAKLLDLHGCHYCGVCNSSKQALGRRAP